MSRQPSNSHPRPLAPGALSEAPQVLVSFYLPDLVHYRLSA